MSSVTIDRSSLSLSDLVIDEALNATYVLLLGSRLRRPAVTWRKTAAPNSVDVHGTEFIAAVKENTDYPFRVMVQANTTADLDAAIDELDEALSQFAYPVTVDLGGVLKVWAASPAPWAPESDLAEAQAVAAFFEVLTVTIPVYPIPGTV